MSDPAAVGPSVGVKGCRIPGNAERKNAQRKNEGGPKAESRSESCIAIRRQTSIVSGNETTSFRRAGRANALASGE
jgi:hypothetical protein